MSRNSAKDVFIIFAALIFIASAVLTFGFFFTHLPSIVPDVVDDFTAAIIAGALGLVIFDGGALAWLKVYLDGSENNDQRNIALSTSVVDITGSAVASFVQILFAGTDLVTLSPETEYTVGIVSLVAMAGVLTFNFVSVWRFHKNSDASKTAIREANRLGRIRAAEEEQADQLDTLVAQKVSEKLAAVSDRLADQQAERIVAERVRLESGKYYESPGENDTKPGRPGMTPAELIQWAELGYHTLSDDEQRAAANEAARLLLDGHEVSDVQAWLEQRYTSHRGDLSHIVSRLTRGKEKAEKQRALEERMTRPTQNGQDENFT